MEGINNDNRLVNGNAPNQGNPEVYGYPASEQKETKVIPTGTEQVNTGSDGLGAGRSRWGVVHDFFKKDNENEKTGGIFEFVQEEGHRGHWIKIGEENVAPTEKPEPRDRGPKEDF